MTPKEIDQKLECIQEVMEQMGKSGFAEDLKEIRKALATAAPDAVRSERKPVAWLHMLDNTEGIKSNKPVEALSFRKRNPFGKPGVDYSKSYPVTSKPLYQ